MFINEVLSSPDSFTDDVGVAVVQIPRSGNTRITAQHPLFVMETASLAIDQTEVVLTLSAGSAVRGRVVDEDRKAVDGAEVQVWAEGDGNSGRSSSRSNNSDRKNATTDREGAFHVEGIASGGSCYLLVKADGFAYAYQSWPETPLGHQEIVLAPAAPLHGFVVDRDGNRVEKAKVELHDVGRSRNSTRHWISALAGTPVQTTGKDGSFQFPGLADGEFELWVLGADKTVVRAHTGPEPIMITLGELSPGYLIVDFEVLDAETLEPVRRPRVKMFGIDEWNRWHDVMSLRDGKDGHFRSEPFLRQDQFFVIEAPGYLTRGIPVSSLPDGLCVRQVLLQKAARSRLISFVAPDGLPVLPDDGAICLGAAVILEDGFMMGSYANDPVPLPEEGIGTSSLFRVRDLPFSFDSFPVDGAILRLETCSPDDMYSAS